jgi:hypothetical protein
MLELKRLEIRDRPLCHFQRLLAYIRNFRPYRGDCAGADLVVSYRRSPLELFHFRRDSRDQQFILFEGVIEFEKKSG